MDVKYSEGDSVIVSADEIERILGISEACHGKIEDISTGVDDSRDEAVYTVSIKVPVDVFDEKLAEPHRKRIFSNNADGPTSFQEMVTESELNEAKYN